MGKLSDRVRAKIRALREAKGWRQQDLADRVGLVATAVSHHEVGRRQIDLDQLEGYAEALGAHLVVEIVPGESADTEMQQLLSSAGSLTPEKRALAQRFTDAIASVDDVKSLGWMVDAIVLKGQAAAAAPKKRRRDAS